MSIFLNPFKVLERLHHDWDKYGALIIAVDFDSTIYPFHDYEKDADFSIVIDLVKKAKALGCTIIINTASHKSRYFEVAGILKTLGIEWDYYNKTPPHIPEIGRDGKVYANLYLDDKAGLSEACLLLRIVLAERELKLLKS